MTDTAEQMQIHEKWMRMALALAEEAGQKQEVPVGAVLVEPGKGSESGEDRRPGELIGSGFNQQISSSDPTAHAEIVALRAGSQFRNNYRLPGSVLYVTIEPCTMCLGALIHARVATVVFAAREPRAGALVSNQGAMDRQHFNHRLEVVEGVLEQESRELIQNFFKSRRQG